ncbi:uncharacterized protein [Rutidosis leptorrhynchoides]|uniref:uncharacterized protein n=1 Tax=Rutidosis leptorrhynchoides TaxID=125765 RepID=UPI003A98F4A6
MLSSNINGEFDWVKIVWNPIVPSKIATFHWLAIQGGVQVKEFLSYRHCLRDSSDDKCVWCANYVESIEHLMLHCSYSYRVWSSLFNWWNFNWVIPSSIVDFSIEWNNGMNIRASRFWALIGPATLWAIWLARNEVIFNGKYTCSTIIASRIKIKVFQWIVNAKMCPSHQFYIWASHPWELL